MIEKRDVVGTLKQERDALRTDNFELKQRSGLTGNDDLLRDYERRSVSTSCLSNLIPIKEELSTARDKLSTLQGSHKLYTEKANTLKTVIESRNVSPVGTGLLYTNNLY